MWVRMVVGSLGLLGWGGCEPVGDRSPEALVEAEGDGMVSVATLWGVGRLLSDVVVREATVISPPSIGDGTVWVQDPEWGHGLAVRRAGHVPEWPPPMGARVRLAGFLGGTRAAPVLWVEGRRGVGVLDEGPTPPRVFDSPSAPLAWTLTRWEGLRVLADPDPAGRALLSIDRELDGRFGVALPGFGSEGDLVGIVMEDGAVAPTTNQDWTGPVGPSAPLERTVRQLLLGEGDLGMTARLHGVQATPWSEGGRWTVVQDPASGVGLFVDAEAWGVSTRSKPGDEVRWVVQVTVLGRQILLRTWHDPEVVGESEVTEAQNPRHGALWVDQVAGVQDPDRFGHRLTSSGLLLDSRFMDLADLPDPAWVRGVLDLSREPPRMAVIEAGPLDP